MDESQIILADILNLNNPNESERQEATAKLTSRISSPAFFQFLFLLIVDPNIQSQTNLFVLILVVLKACVKVLYSNCGYLDENFTQKIPISFIQILDCIPQGYHAHIIEIFRQINQISIDRPPDDTNGIFLNNIQIHIIPFLIEKLKEQKHFLTVLTIFKLFIKFYIKEDQIYRNVEFIDRVFQETLPIFLTVVNSPEINEFTASSVRLIAQILNNSIESCVFIVNKYFSLETIVPFFMNYVRYFSHQFEASKSLNRHLVKLSKHFINCLYDNQEFGLAVYPVLFESVMNLLVNMNQNTWDISTRFICLEILRDFYIKQIFKDEIASPEFLMNILIPSAKLTEENLNDLIEIPYLISSYYSYGANKYSENENKPDSIRLLCGQLANILLVNPELHSIVLQKTDDPIEFESRVFLESFITPSVVFVTEDEIQFILNMAISNIQSGIPFLQASFLCYLSHFIGLIPDISTLMNLAVSYINASNSPIVILAASNLILNDRLDFFDIENPEEKTNIIPKLLSLSTDINCKELLDVIIKLVMSESNKFGDEIPPFLVNVITALFQSCSCIVNKEIDPEFEDRNNHGLDKTFDAIIQILEKIPLNDEIIDFCLKQSSIIFKEIPSEIYFGTFFYFISFFNYQFRPPINAQFDFIMFALSENNEVVPFVLSAIYPLILNPQSNISERQDFAKLVNQACQISINKIIQKEFFFIDFEALLRVCGAMIEVLGNDFIGLSEFAFLLFHNFDKTYFSALLYVLYNALKVNPPLILSKIDNVIFDCLLSNFIVNIYHEQFDTMESGFYGSFYTNEVKYHFCLLLELAKFGRMEGAPELFVAKAEECFNVAKLVIKSFDSACDKGSNHWQPFSVEAIRSFPTSISQVNERELFFSVAQLGGFEITEIDMNLINSILPKC